MLQLGGRPAAQRIAEVSAMGDPVARNRAITETYHGLAVAVRSFVGGPDASWCAFAVWASGTAGTSIKLDQVPGRVDELLRGSGHYGGIRRALSGIIEHSEVLGIVNRTCDQVSADIAAGNVLVFNELAPGRRPRPSPRAGCQGRPSAGSPTTWRGSGEPSTTRGNGR